MSSEGMTLHDWLVGAIAELRFNYPNRRHPDWTCFTNTASERMVGLDTGNGIVYPDIVVVDSRDYVRLLGEVEVFTGITRTEALQWAEYADLCPYLFLYVPEGYEELTADYLTENRTEIAGLRTYDFEDSELVITNMRDTD